MKKFFCSAIALVATVALLATSCKEDTPTPTPTPDNELTVKIELTSVTDVEAEFTITATNAEEVYYYCGKAGAEPTTNDIKVNGSKMSGNTATSIGLTPDTDYVGYALAVAGDNEVVDKVEFTTEPAAEIPFEGYELNKLTSAVYRNDNEALSGNYEITFGNATNPEWEGDIRIFLDLYNVEDSDPLNPVLPNGVYEPGADYEPLTYNPSYSFVDIVVEGGEIVTTPIMGTVTVERTGATYTITVDGDLLLLDNMPFTARYVGSIQFVQGGTSSYEFFEEDMTVEMTDAQMRYWGGWFYPFADDVGVEMFAGDFAENGSLTRGYYLHLSPVYMPKYADYNAEEVPLAEGTYTPARDGLTTAYIQPYSFVKGDISDFYGERYLTGTYLQYVEGGEVKRVGLVTGGDMVVEHSGTGYNITMNFVADNGVKLNIKFAGELLSVNFNDNDQTMTPRPWTTLTEDHVYNMPAETVGYAYCLGEMIKEGYDSWLLMIFGANSTYPDGYGDMFTTEFITVKGDRTALHAGEYNIDLAIEDRTMFPGTMDYAGSILFTYYGDLTPDEDGYSSQSAPISSGKVNIEALSDGNYKFTFNLVDDADNKITGEWSGVVEVYDISEEVVGASSVQPLRVR